MSTKPIALVTGAAGFIGSHMVDLLLEHEYEVRAIDNLIGGREANLAHCLSHPSFHFQVQDIRETAPDDPIFEDVTYMFHFAGIGDIVPSIEKPVDYLSSNVMGTIHALQGARHAGVEKFVYAASSSCYGQTAELPTTEDTLILPEYPYALSKYMGEEAVLHWGQVYDLPVISMRIFNAYGPRSRTSGAYGAVFGVFLAQKLAGKPFTIVGDGLQTRDFVFATDLAKAFLAAAKSEYTNEVYNVGAGNPQSVNRLVELLDGHGIIRLPKRPGEPDCTWADITKIQEHLGWEPQISFEEGVSIMLQNIEYWNNAPVWDQESIEVATKKWFELLSDE